MRRPRQPAPLCRIVAEACLELGLASGSLLASGFLFFVPLGLLAIVGPYVVRVLTLSVDDVETVKPSRPCAG